MILLEVQQGSIFSSIFIQVLSKQLVIDQIYKGLQYPG